MTKEAYKNNRFMVLDLNQALMIQDMKTWNNAIKLWYGIKT
jgi:hypothetical protein